MESVPHAFDADNVKRWELGNDYTSPQSLDNPGWLLSATSRNIPFHVFVGSSSLGPQILGF